MALRIVTAILGGVLCLFALFTTHALPVFILAIAAGIIGFAELIRIAGLEDRPLAAVSIGLFCYISPVVVAWSTAPGDWKSWAIIWVSYLAGCIGVLQGLRRGYATPMSAAWLGAPLATILITHQQTPFSSGSFALNLALILLIPLWVGDSAAYIVGKAIGRHKLAPSISPSKTWEGSISNFFACVFTAFALGQVLHLAPISSISVGVLAGILGQLGDLAQSALKRVSGLKDSGGILPGHEIGRAHV